MPNGETNAALWERAWDFFWGQIVPRIVSLALRHPIAVPLTLMLLVASGFMARRYTDMATLQESLLEEALGTRTLSTPEGFRVRSF